ncbi:VWA domain-containing protein [Halapricum desulfuricans]|uniref:Secreted protein containing bacterial Ig-like domain and vWFA domain, possible component of type IV pili like system n=1 Tax=Halapricum desulfuricans TaxID=2841257 RepID=A0A897N564_9EURY|nr:VWA domain-containing protein [Halapricum desulfuricans]QSG08002.1 Secreted protein containing bacterial Ig-like domain and vWFA domain, possible component of type IV pili like system [Halapricum desulfuricans]
MAEKTQLYNLSRRKVLAGLGAVGVASVGAGAGTSAFFSDRESFANNSLAAGELDLLVDWQQHYMANGETTFVNAHPDHDGDGEQSIITDDQVIKYSDFLDPEDPDSIGENIPVLDCETIPPLSEADFGVDPTTGEAMDSLVQLADVKPGDSGEITFSLHLCDNPGYIWMQADNVSESEGVNTDPELAVDETDGPDLARQIEAKLWYDADCDNVHDEDSPADIMLTLDFSGSMLYRQFGGVVSEDSIQVNGDNFTETTKIDLVELAAKEFVQYLDGQNADVQVGIAYFDGEGSDDTEPRTGVLQPLTSDLSVVDGALSDLRQKLANVVSGGPGSTPFDGDGDPDPANGGGTATGTYIGEGVDDAQDELASNGRTGARAANIVLSDGESFNGSGSTQFSSPTNAADDARATSPAPATDMYTISVGSANDSVLQQMAGAAADPTGNDPQFFYDVDDPVAIPSVFGVLASQFVAEKVIIEDTLDNILAELADGNGIPLDGNVLTLYDELSDPANDPDRDAFEGDGLMYCVALSWELPFEVGNEVQGDSVTFDLGFYTEQERNNDGSGPAPA